jgi:ubiquinone/menaquinone biosynthesis C-methylase UbiE
VSPLNIAVELLWKRSLGSRIWLADHCRPVFSRLYSVVDTDAEIPIQVAAYRLITERYLQPGDSVLDIGFGLGYGLNIMASKADRLAGIEIDRKAIARAQRALNHPKIVDLRHYNGYAIPYESRSFDVVTCVDVIEHVPDYTQLIKNMCQVARRVVIISTPNKRAEFTKPDGSPMNPWHLREWSFDEFDAILGGLGVKYEWNLLNGNWDGPFEISSELDEKTMALTPAIKVA